MKQHGQWPVNYLEMVERPINDLNVVEGSVNNVEMADQGLVDNADVGE